MVIVSEERMVRSVFFFEVDFICSFIIRKNWMFDKVNDDCLVL